MVMVGEMSSLSGTFLEINQPGDRRGDQQMALYFVMKNDYIPFRLLLDLGSSWVGWYMPLTNRGEEAFDSLWGDLVLRHFRATVISNIDISSRSSIKPTNHKQVV